MVLSAGGIGGHLEEQGRPRLVGIGEGNERNVSSRIRDWSSDPGRVYSMEHALTCGRRQKASAPSAGGFEDDENDSLRTLTGRRPEL